MGLIEQCNEVVIIGAGIAGLAAAKILEQNGISFQLLEASHRIGGRAYSEKLSNNSWFDLGCSYLHNGTINPFVSIANNMKFPIDIKNGNLFDSNKTHYFSNGKKIDFGSSNPFDEAHNNFLKTIQNLQTDYALAETMDIKDPYFPVHCHLCANLNAADPDLISSKDYKASLYKGPDYPVPKGFGNLIKDWAQNINVNLNTKITQINWENPVIKLKSSKGTVFAKKLILTVSTGILSGGDIEMIPSFPKETLTAIDDLPMGTLNKIGVCFKKQLFSSNEQGWYVSWPNTANIQEHEIGSFQVSTTGPQNAVVFAGGRYGKWLEERGSKVMRDYAISRIEDVFGTAYTKNVQSSITTAWSSEPLTKGSYSYAVPGKSGSRKILSNALDKRIYITGEATDTNHYGTAHGAYFSGIRAATEIIANF